MDESLADLDAISDLDRRINSAEFRLTAVLEWVPRIDNRLALLMAVNTASTATALIVAPKVDDWSGLSIVALLITAILLGLSYFNVYLATFPRLKGPTDSLTYFQSINGMGLDEYVCGTGNETRSAYLHDLVEQTHRNSQIVSAKFHDLKWAFRFTLLAVGPWIVTLVSLSSDS